MWGDALTLPLRCTGRSWQQLAMHHCGQWCMALLSVCTHKGSFELPSLGNRLPAMCVRVRRVFDPPVCWPVHLFLDGLSLCPPGLLYVMLFGCWLCQLGLSLHSGCYTIKEIGGWWGVGGCCLAAVVCAANQAVVGPGLMLR